MPTKHPVQGLLHPRSLSSRYFTRAPSVADAEARSISSVPRWFQGARPVKRLGHTRAA